MKNKSLLPILVLAALTLTACNLPSADSASSKQDESVSAEVSSEDPTVYGVEIANKAALQGEWYADTTRDLDVNLTPEANALQELNKKNLVIETSDAEVVAVTGLGLKALKAGTATITVKYHNATDSVAVTILENSAKGKYGVAHEGTAADPFTNEDALTVAKSEKYEGEVYYVKGKVASFYNAPGSRTDGMVAYFLEPATAGGEKFEIYKCFKEDGSALTDDDIWVGGTATAYGAFTKYNSQYETSSAVFVSCEGNKPQPSVTVEATFAEALAIGAALDDGANTWDSYKFQGYVTLKSGTDFYLTATKGETLTKTKSDAAHGERDIYATAIELYGAGKVEALAAKLLEGAKVEVTMKLKNYHGQVENLAALADADVVVKEEGTAWSVPEPEVGTRTLKEFIDGENKADKAYNVTAQIKAFKTGATKDAYGNMTLTDGTNDLVIYGSTLKADALAWDNAGSYSFTNPQDFLKTPETAALKVGNTITMKLIRADYTKDGTTTIQGKGVITNIVAVAATGIQLDKATAEIEIDEKVTLTATVAPADSNAVVEWISSDDTKATVENGVVTGVAAGNVTITARISDAIKADCVVTVKAPAVVENSIKLTAQNLLGYAGTNVAYPSDSTPVTATISEAGFAAVGCGAYGSGIQMRTKNGIVSAIYNTTELNIEKLSMEWASGQAVTAGKDYNVWVEFSNKADFSELVGTKQNVKFDDTTKLAEAIPTAAAKYFKVSHANQGAVYIDLIKVVLADGSGETPQPEVAQPNGAYRGYAVVAGESGDTNMFVYIALGANNKAYVEIKDAGSGWTKVTVDYTFDKTTGLVTIPVGGNYGNLVGTFDDANNKLKDCSATGAAAAALKNNGTMEFTPVTYFMDCEGTSEQLNAVFGRRVRTTSPDAWNETLGDVAADTTNFVSGASGVSREGSKTDKAIGLTLRNDFATAVQLESIGFWVYNPSNVDIELRTWVFSSKSYGGASEIGKLTAKANGWTYCRMGFTKGNYYNVNVCDWTKGGATLTFDDICLF